MTLCSFNDLLMACSEPLWLSSTDISLVVTRKPLTLGFLRSLQEFDVFVRDIHHPSIATLQSNFDDLLEGEVPVTSAFKVGLPRVVNSFVIAKNLNDLLSIPTATFRTPAAYFLVKEEFSQLPFCYLGKADLVSAPIPIKRYHQALAFWALLKEMADHQTEQTLLFFGIRRVEILAKFDLSDLDDEIVVGEISEFVKDQPGSDTRKQIFKSALSELLSNQPPDRAFAYLLQSSEMFSRRLSEGLAIYLAENSPEKLNKQAVSKHFELAEKLEKVISSMEAKSLTIPAAVLLAVKEVKFGIGTSTLNSVILVSAILYLAAMTVAHFSQRSMLKLIKEMIEKAISDLRKEGLAENNPVLTESFRTLDNRRRTYSMGSWIMWVFSFGPLVAVLYAAYWAPVPVPPKTEEPQMRIVPAEQSSERSGGISKRDF